MRKTIIKRIVVGVLTLALGILGYTNPEIKKVIIDVAETVAQNEKNNLDNN